MGSKYSLSEIRKKRDQVTSHEYWCEKQKHSMGRQWSHKARESNVLMMDINHTLLKIKYDEYIQYLRDRNSANKKILKELKERNSGLEEKVVKLDSIIDNIAAVIFLVKGGVEFLSSSGRKALAKNVLIKNKGKTTAYERKIFREEIQRHNRFVKNTALKNFVNTWFDMKKPSVVARVFFLKEDPIEAIEETELNIIRMEKHWDKVNASLILDLEKEKNSLEQAFRDVKLSTIGCGPGRIIKIK